MNRLKWLDMAKAIGIICIVFGNVAFSRSPLFLQFVFSFHFPIFLLIIGYLFEPTTSHSQLLKRSLKNYFLPYLGTVALLIAGTVLLNLIYYHRSWLPDAKKWFLAALYGSGTRALHWPFEAGYIGAVWFLLAMFWGTLLLNFILTNLSDQKYGGVVMACAVAIIAYAGYYTAKSFWLPFSFQAGMTALLFLYLGHLARKADIFERGVIPWSFKAGAFLVWVYCVFFGGKLYLVTNTFSNGLMDVIGAVCGSYCIAECCRLWERKVKIGANVLSFIGRFALPALCVHTIEIKYDYGFVFSYLERLGISKSWGLALAVHTLIIVAGVLIISIIPGVNRIFGIRQREAI